MLQCRDSQGVSRKTVLRDQSAKKGPSRKHQQSFLSREASVTATEREGKSILARSGLYNAGKHAKEIHAYLSEIVNHIGDETRGSLKRKFFEIGSVVLLSVANVAVQVRVKLSLPHVTLVTWVLRCRLNMQSRC